MKKSFYIKCLCLAACCALLLGIVGLTASAGTGREYRVTVDDPVGAVANNSAVLLKNIDNGAALKLVLSGWVKTDIDMAYYEYTLDGGKTWIKDEGAVRSRPDTKPYCPDTYQTAGFRVEINTSELPRGTYDVFLRGYTVDGDMIEVLVLLDVTIGRVDTNTNMYTEINLKAFDTVGDVLSLSAHRSLELGEYNLRKYQNAEIILEQEAAMTLFSKENLPNSFCVSSEAPVQNEDGTYTAIIWLKDVQFAGDLLLSSDKDVKIYRLRLYTNVPDYYNGDLKVHMTSTPYEYFGGANGVDAAVMVDDTVGTYTRLYPVQNTNDPYMYFNLGKYVKDTMGVQISADHYRYAVITMQTPSTNSSGPFRIFLCAGDIHGPHGDSHVAFQATNDDQWHTYVIYLGEESYWTGTVYGMRFDFVDAPVTVNDYANIASIGFYPDESSAKEAAAKPIEPYYESGNNQSDIYKEEGRAPSGREDAITWFDESFSACFSGANKVKFYFDEYGHLMMQATETTNDPYVSFSMQTYGDIAGFPLLKTEDYGVVVLRVLADKGIAGKNFTLYYYADGYHYAQGTRAVGQDFKGGEWEYLVYDMSSVEYWRQDILGFRLDFATQISTGQRVCLSDMLFFADMDAWQLYASEHGIVYGDGVLTDAPDPAPPETEMPTIEIPTQGAGLEYVPPEQSGQGQESGGCQSLGFISFFLLLPLSVMVLFPNKKGDLS